jgi:hypothetical protein
VDGASFKRVNSAALVPVSPVTVPVEASMDDGLHHLSLKAVDLVGNVA